MNPSILFIHGLESSGNGIKGRFLRSRLPGIRTPDFPGPVEQRMLLLETILHTAPRWILIGSSLGGLMATVAAGRWPERIRKMVLLAPALREREYRAGHFAEVRCPVAVFHGIRDEVICIHEARLIASKIFSDHTFTEVDDDHSLLATMPGIDWESLVDTRR